ncbi:MAG: outer membrane protein assembly factor BamE [Pseudomonadota bacterium]
MALTVLHSAARVACAAALIFGLTACVATYRNHGYVPPDELLSEIVVGVDTRDTVAETVGPPSSSGLLNDSGFYYVSSRVRNYGMLEPKIIERRLVAISFDSSGVVRNIEEFGLEDGRVVTLQRRITETAVVDETFLRQLLGNLGNFNPGQFIQ